MLRVIFYLLVLANAVAFAWWRWLAPSELLPVSALPNVPRIVLASEAPPAPASKQCLSVGPFTEADAAARATGVLAAGGYGPRQREVHGEAIGDYSVVVREVASAAAQEALVRRLQRRGYKEAGPAQVTPDMPHGVFVGAFTEMLRAERLAATAGRLLGIDAAIVERMTPTTSYWLDIDIKSSRDVLKAEDLQAALGGQLEVQPCGAGPAPPIAAAKTP